MSNAEKMVVVSLDLLERMWHAADDECRSEIDKILGTTKGFSGNYIAGYEIAGYEGSSGLYYSRLAAVANGEQSIEPVYRVKK